MNEHDIFLAALDIADPVQRAAYLDQACAGDPALRRQVGTLLAAHVRSGEFLDVPALQQMADAFPGDRQAFDETKAEHGDDKVEVNLSFLLPSTDPASLGRLGHYNILEVIGRGACGIVLKGFDETLHRVVAIKVMTPELAATSPARKRFLREARAAAAIGHENVVNIYAVEDQPIPFLVMEYIAGVTLQQKLQDNGPLDFPETVRIGHQIACGLEAAHAMGLIHRDIKPGNILLEQGRNRIKITDFGLARAVDDASITQSGVIAGTPLYMSPEQAQGASIDQRSDLFSLGSVLYVMCTGRPPFRAATTLAVLKRVAEDEPRLIQEIIPEVPDWLIGIVNKLLAKKPADRFASAHDVAERLEHCLLELQRNGRIGSSIDVRPLRENLSERPLEVAPMVATGAIEVSPSSSGPAAQRPQGWYAIAAVAMLLLVGMGMSDAFGVTNVSGTVIRLLSPDGVLVIEVDDPEIGVSIEGEELVITGVVDRDIRLKPGQYKVVASKDGKLVRQELVTVARNGRQVLRITSESPHPAAAAGQTAAVTPAAPNRQPAFLRGSWRVVGDVIEQSIPDQQAMLLFGSPEFGDGDFSCEALRSEGDHGLALIARATDLENYYYFDVGVFNNSFHSIYAKEAGNNWRRIDQQRCEPVPTDRWVKLTLKLRGDSFEGFLDDQRVVSGKDDRRQKGYLGLRTWNETGKYRNLVFTDSTGKILWQGLPQLATSGDDTASRPIE